MLLYSTVNAPDSVSESNVSESTLSRLSRIGALPWRRIALVAKSRNSGDVILREGNYHDCAFRVQPIFLWNRRFT